MQLRLLYVKMSVGGASQLAKACSEVERNNKLPVTFYHKEGGPCSLRAASTAAQAESAAAEHGWSKGPSVVRRFNGNPRFEGVVWAPSRALNGGPGSHATGADAAEPQV